MTATVIPIEVTADERAITLEPRAAQKVGEFLAAYQESDDGTEASSLRLGVRGGGCSGFQYHMAFDEPSESDVCFESEGHIIIVAKEALPLVAGSRIIWVESMLKEGFDVENPNATASCGCGSSFRVDPDATGCSEDAEGPPTSEDAVY